MLARRARLVSTARALPLLLAVPTLAVLASSLVTAQSTVPPPRTETSFEVRHWDFGNTPAGPLRADVLLPRHRRRDQRFPLLIALHGLGEARRGVARGVHAWALDYELGASDLALRHGLRNLDDVFGLATLARWRTLQTSLHAHPYRGLVVVAPYTPDVLRVIGGPLHTAYDAWLAGPLVARARRELPVETTAAATGIDGVSLGGLHALWTGLGHPDVFGVVGALQPAVHRDPDLVAARIATPPSRPPQRVRLVTSDHDVLRPDVLAFDAALTSRGFSHELRELRGPHDYLFNRGPGGVEMLLFHDRTQRGEDSP